MAQIIGGINTSHVPAIGRAIHRGLQDDPYWKPFFDGYRPVHHWLAEARPDVVVVFYNDHGLNFFLDKMPTFAIGTAPSYSNADEGWGIPQVPAFTGEQDLSWHLVESLTEAEFDLTTCQEMVVDHAFTLPMALLWPDQAWPVKVVPICINTVQFPLPTAARCWKLGQAVGRAIRSWESDARVMVLGTGGLSHQLDGERAGFINKEFDLQFMDSLVNDPAWATRFSIHELVEKAGTQGIELLMWLATRGALGESARELHRNYHIPISNTASGLMLLEPTA
ncbi:MAG: protocatechuate 3,4-dioxygenase [Sphaerotilus natans subsp. sulfidivorans]|uniref:class III extradiol dioxygenase family protein n=1 Tax=Sphaerotilus sulfidivorans TaxID=639200 RepID=UPI002355FDE0|nr:class III extradiol dioxygenase family protein [Sphaerotilus sulfidivorans]MCK6404159.1 protocatechuate 3,4-dioxygenase [Sphaerotilus sulfidivorans]